MSYCGPKRRLKDAKFRANHWTEPITEKFYARHENTSDIMELSRVSYFEKELDKVKKFDHRCHSKMPRYTNQTYGWLPGYKIRFLQACDLNLYDCQPIQKLAKDLLQHHYMGEKLLTDHCECKKRLNMTDHWKIV